MVQLFTKKVELFVQRMFNETSGMQDNGWEKTMEETNNI